MNTSAASAAPTPIISPDQNSANTVITTTPSIPTEYQIDTNNDGIPDFIEKNTKYDWQNDECLAKIQGCAGPTLQAGQQKPKNIVVILDASGSMNEVVSSEPKIKAAQNALDKFIATVPSDVNVALIVYGTHGSNSQSDQAISCAGIDVVYPLGPVDRANFTNTTNAIQAKGWTPLASAIGKVQSILAGHEGEINEVILLTDGEETCGGNPITAAQGLRAVDAKTNVDIIAFAVTASDRSGLQQIAQAGGGEYKDVNSESDLDAIFRESSNRLQIANYQACTNGNWNDYQTCALYRILAAQDYVRQQEQQNPPGSSMNSILDSVNQSMYTKYQQQLQQQQQIYQQKYNAAPTYSP